jgi:hypothetical protein
MVYYFCVTLRDRIRKLIGWDEMQKRLDLSDSRLAVLVDRADAQDKRIALISYKRSIEPVKQVDLDWEAQQQAFLNNPENFKEVN